MAGDKFRFRGNLQNWNELPLKHHSPVSSNLDDQNDDTFDQDDDRF